VIIQPRLRPIIKLLTTCASSLAFIGPFVYILPLNITEDEYYRIFLIITSLGGAFMVILDILYLITFYNVLKDSEACLQRNPEIREKLVLMVKYLIVSVGLSVTALICQGIIGILFLPGIPGIWLFYLNACLIFLMKDKTDQIGSNRTRSIRSNWSNGLGTTFHRSSNNNSNSTHEL
jgi:hypothetical protein